MCEPLRQGKTANVVLGHPSGVLPSLSVLPDGMNAPGQPQQGMNAKEGEYTDQKNGHCPISIIQNGILGLIVVGGMG